MDEAKGSHGARFNVPTFDLVRHCPHARKPDAAVSGMDTSRRARFFDYLAALARLDYPTERAADLATARAATPAKWHEFIRFCVYVVAQHGTYGTRIYPSQMTLAEGYGADRRTVGRWLTLAESLGILRRVADPSPVRGTEYEIGDLGRATTAIVSPFDEPPW
ncbi:MAG: helix-turn-helix domain-containing protein [Actinomycetales bacterium]